MDSSYCNGLNGLSTNFGVFGIKSGVVLPVSGATDPMPTDTGPPGIPRHQVCSDP